MRKIFALFFLFLLSFYASSQVWKLQRFEVYGAFTTFHFFGDIGGSADKSNLFGLKDISIRSTRPGFSAGGIFRLDEKIYLKADYSFGFLAANDVGSKNAYRGYAFSSLANEISVRGVYFIIPESNQNYYYTVMQLRGGLRKLNRPISVYTFLGVGSIFYHLSPNTELQDRIINDNIETGHNFAMLFPFGIGIKYAFIPRISLGAELSARYVLSDYLDGFSTQYSKFNDLYYQINFKVYYRFPRSKSMKGYNQNNRRR